MSIIQQVMGYDTLIGLYKAEKESWELTRPVFPSYTEWKEQENLVAANPGDEKAIRGLYQEEKDDAIGRFPAFKKWKEDYEKEWIDSHKSSSFISGELAMEMSDADVAYILS